MVIQISVCEAFFSDFVPWWEGESKGKVFWLRKMSQRSDGILSNNSLPPEAVDAFVIEAFRLYWVTASEPFSINYKQFFLSVSTF